MVYSKLQIKFPSVKKHGLCSRESNLTNVLQKSLYRVKMSQMAILKRSLKTQNFK